MFVLQRGGKGDAGGVPGNGHFSAVCINGEEGSITVYDSLVRPRSSTSTSTSIIFSSQAWQGEKSWIVGLADACFKRCHDNESMTTEWRFVEGAHCREEGPDQVDNDNCIFHAALFLAKRLKIAGAEDMHKKVRFLRWLLARIMCDAFDAARRVAASDGIEAFNVVNDGPGVLKETDVMIVVDDKGKIMFCCQHFPSLPSHDFCQHLSLLVRCCREADDCFFDRW